MGLDLHPEVFSAAALEGMDPVNARVCWLDDKVQIDEMEAWARRRLKASDVVVIEAGQNSFAVARKLQAWGYQVLILESTAAGQIRKSYCNNDKLSAVKLGRIYLSGLARLVWQPDLKTRDRRQLLHAYLKSVTHTTRCRNRLQGIAVENAVRLPKGLRLTQPSGRDAYLKASEWTPIQKLIIEQLFADLHQSEQQRKNLRRAIAREVAVDPLMSRLLTLMGVRDVVAFALVAIIGDISRFRNPKALCAYIGLVAGRKDSGKTERKLGLIRHGRGDLRRLLVQSAQCLLRQPGHKVGIWGRKVHVRKNHKQVAVVAVARKLAVSIWYVLKGLYQPEEHNDQSLGDKLGKVARSIGAKALRELGYQSYRDFIEKRQAVLNSPWDPLPG